MKIKLTVIQLSVIVAIMTILFFSFNWIIIHIQEPKESFKESMDLTISFLGPISTIFASILATYLFNDWKEQHNKTVIANEAKIAFNLICADRHHINDLIRELPKSKNKSNRMYFKINDDVVSIHFELLVKNCNENRSELFDFILLVKGKSLFNEILEYRNEIDQLSNKVIEWNRME